MKIITVEDPVEYQLKGVNQIPVKPKIGLTFAAGLRHIVRQDPDVIMVGEIRDLETAEIAIQAALTGHLVFSTLHTNDAPGRRHAAAGHGRRAVSDRLRAGGRAAQRLVRRICASCRVPDSPIAGRSARPRHHATAAGVHAVPRQGLRRVPRHRLPRAAAASTSCSDRRGRSAASSLRKRLGARDPRHAIERGMVTLAAGRLGQGPARASRPSRRSCASRRRTPDRMPVFAYRAADRRGQTIDGVMEAADARAVVERLQRDAYFPIRVAAAGRARQPARARRGRTWAAAGCASRDLLAFTQQLATLVEAGLPLDRALAILEELAPTRACARSWPTCCTACAAAARWPTRSAKHHPRPFSRLYINMVRAGERGGVLETTLRRLAEFLEESQEFREAVVSALDLPGAAHRRRRRRRGVPA